MPKTKVNRVGKIPKFVKKLSQILENPQLSDLISWLPDGNGFQIHNVPAFTEQVLPIQFKHKNMASFVRQLNMYGFSRPSDSHQHVYMHPRFQNGNLNNMKFIKRKSIISKQENSGQDSQQSSESIVENVKNEQQRRIKTENMELKRENEQLKKKLREYQEMRKKIREYCNGMNGCLQLVFDEVENDRNQKQTNSSDSTQMNGSNKSSFNIFRNNCNNNSNISYNLLLQPNQQPNRQPN